MSGATIGTVVGAVIGFAIGGPVGMQIGALLGGLAGSLLDPPKYEGPKLTDLKLMRSEYGTPIPIIFGTMRIAGNVIWQTDLNEHQQRSGGKGGPENTTYTYSCSFAIMLCEGPIDHIVEVYADGRLLWPSEDDGFSFTLYKGTEDQLPDPTMEAELGVGEVPAHRGYAYVVFTDLGLEDFGNRLPQLQFVVATVDRTTGPITLLSQNTLTSWPDKLAITSWQTDWASNPVLENPTGTTGPLAAYIAPIGPTVKNCVPVGDHVYADGSRAELWYAYGAAETVGGGNVIRLSRGRQIGGSDWAEEVGIPLGVHVGAVACSVDGLTTLVFTRPSGSSEAGTDIDTWHRVINGAVVATGTVSPTLSTASIGIGNRSVYGAQTSCILENSGDIVWAVIGNVPWTLGPHDGMALRILSIDSLGNFAFDAASDYGYPLPTGSRRPSLYITEEGYCGVITGNTTSLFTRLGPDNELTYGDIVSALSARTTLDPSEYDTSALTDVCKGFQISSNMEVRNAIQPLRQANFFDAVERDGVIVYVKRGGASVVTIPDDDLAARPDGSEAPALRRLVRKQEAELPKRVTVDFIDASFDYQKGSQYAERLVTGSESLTTLALPISLTNQEAKSIAGSHVWGAYQERENFTWWTGREYAKYEPTDVQTVQGLALRVESKKETHDGVIEWSGVISRADLYGLVNQPALPGPPTPPGQEPPRARAATELVILDIPLIRDDDLANGPYVAMGPAMAGKWTGASLFKSADAGTTNTEVATSSIPAAIGTTTAALGDYLGGNTFDEINTVEVVLSNTDITLESATELAVLNGANTYAIGHELVQFKNATLTAPGTYTLSGLLRGRRGSEWAISGHSAGDVFAEPQIDMASPYSELGSARLYKAVSFGKPIASVAGETFTNQGVRLKPYAPTQIGGGAGGAGAAATDITINWIPRALVGGSWRDFVGPPTVQTTATVLEIRNASYSLVARVVEIPAGSEPTFIYTAAMQTADFGALQETVYCTVAVMGSYSIGTRGHGVIAGAGSTVDAPLVPVPPYASPAGPAPGPTNPVNFTLAWDGSDSPHYTAGYVIGDTYVVEFTTDSDPVGPGNISAAEYGDPAYYRTVVLSTDTGGLAVVATRYGNTVDFIFGTGPGEVSLATTTTYYFIVKTTLPDGTPSSPLGSPADMIITF